MVNICVYLGALGAAGQRASAVGEARSVSRKGAVCLWGEMGGLWRDVDRRELARGKKLPGLRSGERRARNAAGLTRRCHAAGETGGKRNEGGGAGTGGTGVTENEATAGDGETEGRRTGCGAQERAPHKHGGRHAGDGTGRGRDESN